MRKDIFLVLLLALVIGFVSIKNGKPPEQSTVSGSKYKIVSVEFDLTDDSELAGEVKFFNAEPKADFIIKNVSKEPFDFKNAKYYVIKKDNSKFLLEFKNIENPDFAQESYIVNPAQMVRIFCIRPSSLEIIDMQGAYIQLDNGRNIHFEYEGLPNQRSEVMGIKKVKDHPKAEGWEELKTSTGKIFYYKKVQEDCSDSAKLIKKSKKDFSYLWNCP